MNHTPGPWFYNSYNAVFSKPLSDEFMRMEQELDARLKVEGRDFTDEDFANFPDACVATVQTLAGDTATPRGAADARLIAAAPELLEALRLAVHDLQALSIAIPALQNTEGLVAGLAAIRKAETGEEPGVR